MWAERSGVMTVERRGSLRRGERECKKQTGTMGTGGVEEGEFLARRL